LAEHFSKENMLKRIVQRLAKWVAYFAAIVIILLVALYLLRGVVVAPFFQRYLENLIASQLGLSVTIGDISGSYVSELVVTNVTTPKPASAGPWVDLELKRLRVTYSLFSLFNGLNDFLAAAAIELEGVILKFDLVQEETISTSDGASAFFLPPQLPRIQIRNATVVFQGVDYTTAFRGIEVETRRFRPMTSVMQLRVAEWTWTHPDLQDGTLPVSAEIEYSGEQMAVHSLMLGKREAAEYIRIGLQGLPETIPFNAKFFFAGGQLALDGRLDHSDLYTRINAQQIDLAGIFAIFTPQPPSVSGLVAMKADIVLPQLQLNALAAEIDLNLTRGGLFGLAADELVLRAVAKDGRAQVDLLDLHSGENSIQLKNVIFPMTTVLNGDLTGLLESLTGEFLLECRDIPALFSLAGAAMPPAVDSISAHRLALNGELRHGSVYFSNGDLTADGGYLQMETSRVQLPTPNRPLKDLAIQADLKIDFPDLSLLSGIFAVPQLTGSLKSDVRVTGTLGSPSGKASIEAKALAFQGMNYGDMRIKATSDSQTAVIESLMLQRGEDRLFGKGRFHFGNLELEDAQLEFKIAELAAYTANSWPSNWTLHGRRPRISGAVDGNVTVAGPIQRPSGTLIFNGRRLKCDEILMGNAAVRLQANGQKITVETLEIRNSEDFVALNGSFDFSSGNFENVRMRIAIANVPAYTQDLLGQDLPVPLAIQGTVTMSGPLKEPEADIAVDLKQLNIGDVAVASASFKALNSGRRMDIQLAEAHTAFGQVSVSGHLLRDPDDSHFDLQLNRATLASHGQTLKLDKPAQIYYSRSGPVTVKDLYLTGSAGNIRLDGVVGWNGRSDLNVFISDFNSQGWFDSLATDQLYFNGLNAHIHLGGSMASPSVTVAGDLARIGHRTHRMVLSGRFDLSYAGEMVTIRQFEWQGGESQQLAVSGTLPLNLVGKPILMPGPLQIDARVNLADLEGSDFDSPDGVLTGGSFKGELQMTGTWDAPAGKIIFQGRGLNRPAFLKPMPPGPFDIDGRMQLGGEKVVIESIQIHSPHLSFSSSGEWNGMPALADLLRGKTRRMEGDVSVQGDLVAADLSWITAEIAGLRRVSGRLEADVTIKGPIADPAITATVRLTDGEMRPDMNVPSIQMLNLEVAASPRGVQIQTFTGQLGGAAFHITGSVTRDGEIGTFADLRLFGENLLFYRSEEMMLRADTDLAVKGPLSRLAVTGGLNISDGRLVKYFDLLSTLRESSKPKTDSGFQLFSFRRPPLRDMQLDVSITSRTPFAIRNNLTRGAVRPELKLGGSGEAPVLSGKVYVDPTVLILPTGRIVFESGIILFDANHPDRPTLELIGESRLLGYDITVLVEGPYNEPIVTLSSVPPLSNEELLLLVIAGKHPKPSGGSSASQGRSVNIAVYVGRDLIARWFGMESMEAGEAIFDRFEVETGKALTRAGDETIDARFRLTEDVLRDGDTLYITGEKDVFDFYNAGVRIVFRFK
jgi:autotransporter translocation and assembly factor TamB